MIHNEALKECYVNKPVLVTGGAGFIGSHLVDRLVTLGAKVTALDNLSTGNLTHLQKSLGKISFIEGDITEAQTCLRVAQNQAFVFHLAALTSVTDSMQRPNACKKINVDGTANLLKAAVQYGIKKFIFSSSSAVYGNRQGACSEEDPCNPQSPYGESKWAAEQLCFQFRKEYGLKTIILRYFNVFGERQNPQGEYAAVYSKFRYQMKNDLPVTIFGNGDQTRDFIPVEEVVQANLLFGMLPDHLLRQGPYNIACGKSMTILELFEKIKKDFPSYHLPPQFAPERTGDIKHSSANCKHYLSILSHFYD